MKIKLDENVPAGLANFLTQKGYDTKTIPEQNLKGSPDSEVWQVVQREKRFFITMDLDFSDIRKFAPGSHEGILLLRPAREGRQAIIALFQSILEQFDLASFYKNVVVASEGGLRIRKSLII